MVQVRELKAALDTKQGNVSPDTLLALLEAANQEVEMSFKQLNSFLKVHSHAEHTSRLRRRASR